MKVENGRVAGDKRLKILVAICLAVVIIPLVFTGPAISTPAVVRDRGGELRQRRTDERSPTARSSGHNCRPHRGEPDARREGQSAVTMDSALITLTRAFYADAFHKVLGALAALAVLTALVCVVTLKPQPLKRTE
jgi:hypothetical protein